MKTFLLILTLFVFNNYNFSQDYLWSVTYGTVSIETPSKFAVSSQGDIISTGYSDADIDLDPSAATSLFTNNGSRDLYIQKLNAQGDFVWGKYIGSTGQDVGNNIVVDNSDNIYVLGTYNGTVNFNPNGTGGTVTSNGNRDIFLLKLNSNGDFIWVKSIGANGDENAFSLKVDNNNNLYISGVFYNTVDFGLGTSPKLETSIGYSDAFVLKLDNNGDYIWVNTYGNANQDYAGEILLSSTNEVYIAGGFANTVDFEYGPGSTTLTSAGGFFGLDSYLLKLNTLGQFVWVKNTATSIGDVFVWQSKMDNMGNIYNIGSVENTTDFDPSSTVNDASTSPTSSTSFIQKLDSDGNLVWVKLNGDLQTRQLTFTSSNNLLLVGEFNGTQDFDLGSNLFNLTPVNSIYAAFFQTINSNGDFVNAYLIDGYNNQTGRYMIKDLKYTSNNDLLVYGQFSGTIDLNVSPTQFATSTSAGSNDVFLLKQTNFDVGIESNSIDISIYPNPTTGQITIETNNTNSSLNIYNIKGEVIYSDQIVKKYTLYLNEAPGVYFIELKSSNSILKQKLIKL